MDMMFTAQYLQMAGKTVAEILITSAWRMFRATRDRSLSPDARNGLEQMFIDMEKEMRS